MKLLHLADLHLGKRVNEFSLLADQRHVLEQALALADRHAVDAVLLAGDLYDKPVPPAEAVELLDWFLTALTRAGHKVLAVPSADGKLTGREVRRVYESHWQDATREHMVQPGMVYLSQPTENGTLYSLAELTDLWETCQDCGLFLFVDGARLVYGLMSEACDMTLPDLARRCDGFSIGGTKQGLLFGEALVLSHPALRRDFRYHIKQHGGLLAKGRLLGVQFCAILEDGLYFELARHADRLAMELRRAFETRGYEMLFDSYTNQQYPILPDGLLAQLEEEFALAVWSKVDGGHTAVRVCTSWATEPQAVQALIRALDRWEET